ncbi:hypothetical protein GCM10023084_58920 [Streptomyces lacrimifluminis]|uniref:AttH domain-containing protein n=1 Tax=Streptomyces lacrimifluminis TaxID=1500077 RepID=A0A917P282_9ACTN|nr:hypothetical protein [Streptomyces lacrimifluminis]GGJ55418.1 hypothetical protein GCM10012282_60680 [Streptomyces lacrimifluminis]
MPIVKHVHPRGHFLQMLSGAHQPTIEDVLSDRSYYGLPPGATFVYGRLDDEQGEIYEVCRSVNHNSHQADGLGGGVPRLLLFQSTLIDDTTLRYDMERMQAAASAEGAVGVREGEEAVWRQAAGVPGQPFEVRYGLDSFTWREEGLFELTGTPINPGLHWYLPGRDYGTYYVSQFVEVTGTVLGRPVRGMLAFDQVYMHEEGTLYRDKDLVMENEGHLLWYTWATRYKDGSFEGGHFIVGHDRLGFGVVTDGKQVLATQDVDVRVYQRDGTPFAEQIALNVDGQQWEFLRHPKGSMPDMVEHGQPPTPQQEGRFRRVGDTREPATWFAWGETEPKHGAFRGDPVSKSPLA